MVSNKRHKLEFGIHLSHVLLHFEQNWTEVSIFVAHLPKKSCLESKLGIAMRLLFSCWMWRNVVPRRRCCGRINGIRCGAKDLGDLGWTAEGRML